MKILHILTLMLIMALPSHANPVGEQAALKKAQTFLKDKKRLSADEQLHLAYRSATAENADNAYFYVFNQSDGKGFIILSGDDRTVPVLGYAEQGSFDIDHLSPNVKWWMDYYQEAIKEVVENKWVNTPAHARPTDVIQPLLTTKWDQTPPYNGMCPVINGAQCPTGCVATAMAQILYYHRCPVGETAAIPGYTTYSYKEELPSLPATIFDWENMHNSYNSNSSQESKDAVAKLMQYCGQAVEMDYTPASSGAQTDRLVTILPRYFKFPWTIHNVSREGYSIAQWDSLLINELKNDRPVLYTGYTSAWEGHAFVCDGYDGKGFYHINWGWSGAADGYYRISVLDATANGVGGSSTSLRFNVMQSALIGVKAEGEDDYVQPEKEISVGRASLKSGREYVRDENTGGFGRIVVAQRFVNISDQNARKNNFSLGMGLFDDEGVMVKKLVSTDAFLWSGYPMVMELPMADFGKDFTEGHFTIYPIFKYSDGDWQLAMNADLYHIDVNIEGNNLTLTPVPKADFKVNRVRKSGNNVLVRLTNEDEEFCGELYVRKIETDGSIGEVASESICIEENSEREIAVYIDDNHSLDIDKEAYFLSVDVYDDQYFYSNVTNEGTKLDCEIKVANLSEDQTTIIGDKVMCTFNVTNEGEQQYKHYFVMALINADGETVYSEKNLLHVPEKGSISVVGEIPLVEFGEGYRLSASAFEDKDVSVICTSDPYSVAKGAIYWTANGEIKTQLAADVFHVPDDALTINLRNAFTRNVVANANPNTVYLLDKTVPNGLAGKNVFNYENMGGILTIYDGYDFFSPVELQISKNIKFMRSFDAADLTKWSSIVLPFAPVRMQVDDKKVEWFKNPDDYGKDFWLQRIAKVSGDEVVLAYADEFKAGEPYLLAIGENLAGKTLEFVGLKTTLAPSSEIMMGANIDGYTFKGTTCSTQRPSVYLIDDNQFVFNAGDCDIPPFRVFAESDGGPQSLTINGPSILSGIQNVTLTRPEADDVVYYLNGQRAGKYSDVNKLHKGIYVVKGMKLVVK